MDMYKQWDPWNFQNLQMQKMVPTRDRVNNKECPAGPRSVWTVKSQIQTWTRKNWSPRALRRCFENL